MSKFQNYELEADVRSYTKGLKFPRYKLEQGQAEESYEHNYSNRSYRGVL